MATKFETITGGNYPSDPVVGQCVFNGDAGGPEWWDGTNWLGGDGIASGVTLANINEADFDDLIAQTGYAVATDKEYAFDNNIFITPQNKLIYARGDLAVDDATFSGLNFGILCICDFDPATGAITLLHSAINKFFDALSNPPSFGQEHYSIAATDDAKTVAVGAPSNYAEASSAGGIAVYDFDDNGLIYEQYIEPVAGGSASNGKFGKNTVMSDDGLLLSSGSYGYDSPRKNAGTVEIWQRAAVGEDFTYVGNILTSISGRMVDYFYYEPQVFSGKSLFVGSKYSSTTNNYAYVLKVDIAANNTFTITEIPKLTTTNLAVIDSIYGVTSTITSMGNALSVDHDTNMLYILFNGTIYNSTEGVIAEYDLTNQVYTDNYWTFDTGKSSSNISHFKNIPVNGKLLVKAYASINEGTVYIAGLITKNNEDDFLIIDTEFKSTSYVNLSSKDLIIREIITEPRSLLVQNIGDLY